MPKPLPVVGKEEPFSGTPEWSGMKDGSTEPGWKATADVQSGAGQASAAGQVDKPTPLSRWYGTVQSIEGSRAVVVLDDDSDGESVITVPVESTTPVADDRVIVDFREDGLVVVSAVVA